MVKFLILLLTSILLYSIFQKGKRLTINLSQDINSNSNTGRLMHPSKDVAEYFLNKAEGRLTPLQLQKLVYFSHGWSLALREKALITEGVEAWRFGPVIRPLYNDFKKFGSGEVREFNHRAIHIFDQEERVMMDTIWDIYGNLNGLQMSRLTHMDETPWTRVWEDPVNPKDGSAKIDNKLIQEYYKSKLEVTES